MNGACGNGVGLDLRRSRREALLHMAAQQDHCRHQDHCDHRDNDQNGTDDLPLAFFLVGVERVKQFFAALILFTHSRRSL